MNIIMSIVIKLMYVLFFGLYLLVNVCGSLVFKFFKKFCI